MDSDNEESHDAAIRWSIRVLLGREPKPDPLPMSPSLLAHAHRRRVATLLLALESSPGEPLWVADGSLTQGALPALRAQLRAESAAARVVDVLEAAGIPSRVLKGVAVAQIDYPDPSMRTMADADLLVPVEAFEEASAAIQRAGHRLMLPAPHGWWQIHHAATFVVDGTEVDLHHRLLPRGAGHAAGRLGLFDDPDPILIAGRPASALPGPLRLLQAAGQNVLVSEAGRRLASDIDVLLLDEHRESALAMARWCGLDGRIRSGFRRADELIDRPSASPQPGSGWRGALLDRAYAEPVGSVLRETVADVALAPPSTTLRTLASAIVPDEQYLRRRRRSRSEQMKRQVARVVPRPPGRRSPRP